MTRNICCGAENSCRNNARKAASRFKKSGAEFRAGKNAAAQPDSPASLPPPMCSYPLSVPYTALLFHSKSIPTVLKFFYEILHDFFLLQFAVKFKLKKIPVIRADNTLDNAVPFTPEKITTYLGFINYWIHPLSFMLCRMGTHRGLAHCIRFLKLMTRCYKEAARIYRFRMTTTRRPDCFVSPAFSRMWRADPHLLCVPSLHVSICILTYTFYRDLFEREADFFSAEEKNAYNGELYKQAVAIIESVLYVKQHSVNCIPAALYMMTHIPGVPFTIQQAVEVIQELFAHSSDISEQNKKLIRAHILHMFEQLLLEGCCETDWTVPVKRWLLSYTAS
ncbi:MAG: hypothetical protein NC041_09595 [Bacteroides sp.]|nr:hypothetical protein [Prevotella sp.]MCM1408630.1 hypothetical protein [Treponema brennaborense]MCM1470704.1 hypothetical protein [Bacteroides sp.]